MKFHKFSRLHRKNFIVWRDVKSQFRLVIYQRKSNFTMNSISKYTFHLFWNFLQLIGLLHPHWQKRRFLPHFLPKMTQRHQIKFLFRYSFSVARQLSNGIWYVDIRIGLWHYLKNKPRQDSIWSISIEALRHLIVET